MTEQKTDIRSVVGDRVRHFRERNEWTLHDLSDASGLHPSSISQIERGERNITLKNLNRLADGLDVKMYRLLLAPNASGQVVDPDDQEVEEWLNDLPSERREKIYRLAQVLLDWEPDER